MCVCGWVCGHVGLWAGVNWRVCNKPVCFCVNMWTVCQSGLCGHVSILCAIVWLEIKALFISRKVEETQNSTKIYIIKEINSHQLWELSSTFFFYCLHFAVWNCENEIDDQVLNNIRRDSPLKKSISDFWKCLFLCVKTITGETCKSDEFLTTKILILFQVIKDSSMQCEHKVKQQL